MITNETEFNQLKEKRFHQAFNIELSEKERNDILLWYVTTNCDGFSYCKVPNPKESDIVVGAKFWYDNSDFLNPSDIRLMTITYIRSGVAFYIDDKDETERNFFTSGTLFSERMLDYFEYVTDKNPELFKLTSQYDKTIIKYKNK